MLSTLAFIFAGCWQRYCKIRGAVDGIAEP